MQFQYTYLCLHLCMYAKYIKQTISKQNLITQPKCRILRGAKKNENNKRQTKRSGSIQSYVKFEDLQEFYVGMNVCLCRRMNFHRHATAIGAA